MIRRDLDHVEAELTPARPWLLASLALVLLVLAGLVGVAGRAPLHPLAELPAQPSAASKMPWLPDCSLQPDEAWCADMRPILLHKPITPGQAYDEARHLAPGAQPVIDRVDSAQTYPWRNLTAAETEAVQELRAQRRSLGKRHRLQGQDDYAMPDPPTSLDEGELRWQRHALQAAFEQRERLHLAWRPVLRARGYEDSLQPLDHDRWLVERARWRVDALRHRQALQSRGLTGGTAVVMLGMALILLLLAGAGRRRIRVRVTGDAVFLDDQRISSTEVVDVRWSRGRLIIEGTSAVYASRPSANDAEGISLVAAIEQLLGDHALRHEEAAAERRVRAESATLRDRA